MLDKSKIKVGDKVHYQPDYFEEGKFENGIVKELTEDDSHLRVVFHCDNDWNNFSNYTGAYTMLKDLKLGWR